MSDTDRLRQSLGKLITPGETVGGGRRVLHGASPEALVAAILGEIDESVLARALVFDTDDGRSLCLEAYNRRLIRLVSAEPAPPAAIAGLMLASADEGELSAVRDALLAFAAGASALAVEAGPPRGKIAATDLGPTAAGLARLWNIADSGGESIDSFVKSVNDAAVAWLWLGAKGVRSSGGDPAAIARLTAMDASGDLQFARPGGSTCQVSDGDGTGAVLLARIGSDVILAELAAGRSDDVLDAWRRQGR